MANALYDSGREGFLDGSYSWSSATVKAMLVGAGYTPNLATDKFVSIIPGGAIVARSAALTGKTETGGVANAANYTFGAVGGVVTVTQLVIYEDTGSDSTSRLIAHIDTATGLPITPSGGAITISWDTGASKVFVL